MRASESGVAMQSDSHDGHPLTLREARTIAGEVLLAILLRLEAVEKAVRGLTRPPAAPDLSPMERSVLAAVEPSPLTAKKLAGKLGKKAVSGHLRAALRSLVRRGLVHQTPDGYRSHP